MSQYTSGWRSCLSLPGIYGLLQTLLGGPSSLRYIIKTYIRPVPGMRILDLGCGPATIMDSLPEHIDYVGVDLSPAYIYAARKKYGKRGEFHCLPVESLQETGLTGFDLVMGLGVLHHLDNAQAARFFSIAAKALKHGGRCMVLDPCLVPGQHPVARLLIRMDRGRNVRTADDYAVLAKANFPLISQTLHHDLLRIPYTLHIMECWPA